MPSASAWAIERHAVGLAEGHVGEDVRARSAPVARVVVDRDARLGDPAASGTAILVSMRDRDVADVEVGAHRARGAAGSSGEASGSRTST